MQHQWNTIWSFKTKRFTVTLDWEWEEDPDLSWDETGEVIAKLQSGEWGNYTFRLRVLLDGREIACDYLENSIYADPMEFYREHIGLGAKRRADGKNYGDYFSDMVRQAIGEARSTLRDAPYMRRT